MSHTVYFLSDSFGLNFLLRLPEENYKIRSLPPDVRYGIVFNKKSIEIDGVDHGTAIILDPSSNEHGIGFEIGKTHDGNFFIKSVYQITINTKTVFHYPSNQSPEIQYEFDVRKAWGDSGIIVGVQAGNSIAAFYNNIYAAFEKHINSKLEDPFRPRHCGGGIDRHRAVKNTICMDMTSLTETLYDLGKFLPELSSGDISIYLPRTKNEADTFSYDSIDVSSQSCTKEQAALIKQFVRELLVFYKPYGESEHYVGGHRYRESSYKIEPDLITIGYGLLRLGKMPTSTIEKMNEYVLYCKHIEKISPKARLLLDKIT